MMTTATIAKVFTHAGRGGGELEIHRSAGSAPMDRQSRALLFLTAGSQFASFQTAESVDSTITKRLQSLGYDAPSLRSLAAAAARKICPAPADASAFRRAAGAPVVGAPAYVSVS